jgi:hypothetical protein
MSSTGHAAREINLSRWTANPWMIWRELGDELPVFVRYARTMLAAQLLEFTVFQLTHLKK